MNILITFFVILNSMGMWLDPYVLDGLEFDWIYVLDGLDINVAGYVCSTK